MVESSLLVLAASLLITCTPSSAPSARAETKVTEERSVAPVEPSPEREAVTVSYAVYAKVMGKQLASVAAPAKLANAILDDCSESCDALRETLAVPKALAITIGTTSDLPPPDFFFPSKSMGAKEKNRLRVLPGVAMIGVTGSPSPPYPALRAATDAARMLAEQLDGLVFDPASYRLSTPGDLSLPKPSEHPSPWGYLELGLLEMKGGIRAVTFGMAKFGRPDLVVDRIPKQDLPLAVGALGAVASRLMVDQESDRFEISSSDLEDGEKEGSLGSVLREGTVTIRLKAVARRPSDPVNRLVRLEPGDEQLEGLAGALAARFLREDDKTGVGAGAASL